MNLTFKLGLDSVKMNQHSWYLGQRLFNSEVIVLTQTNTHPTDCCTA